MFNKKKLEKNTIYGETKKDENVSEVSEEITEKVEETEEHNDEGLTMPIQQFDTIKSEAELDLERKREFFHGEPLLNVLSKEKFQDRVAKVFSLISDTLAASFGAYGSPVIISNYPYTHVTKDGYTIYKNITFDAECGSLVDCTISNMIGDICGRLNYKVGDGTTTAIVATNSIYHSYYESKKFFDDNFILPRDIIKEFSSIKDELVKKIDSKSVKFTNNHDDMVDAIRKIVHISSNGDDKVTDMITEIYDKVGYPSISVELSKDGVTRYELTEGYRGQVFLTDKLYINSDDGFSDHKNIDVIMFDHKVETECYRNIIYPLHKLSKQMGRDLLVIAPTYSDTTMQNIIRKDMLDEYKREKNLSLILTTCKAVTATAKRNLADLAMLLDTTIIDRQLEHTILNDAAKHPEDTFKFLEYFNYNRGIAGSYFLYEEDGVMNTTNSSDPQYLEKAFKTNDEAINIGFVGECRIGVDYSVFSDLHYNEDLYGRFLDDAKKTMDDLVDKYAKLGTFNYEVTEAIKRYNALQLKTAVIEAGGDSELSKAMLKDTIEDAIRAADSAYNHGYISGCNLTTIRCIYELLDEVNESDMKDFDRNVKNQLLTILLNGFINVYKIVLSNAYPDINIAFDISMLESDNSAEELNKATNSTFKEIYKLEKDIFNGNSIHEMVDYKMFVIENEQGKKREEYFEANKNLDPGSKMSIICSTLDLIIKQSIDTGKVFDLENKEFSDSIINSAATDIEILTAIVDLTSILITGNQLVMTGKHNF